MAQALAFVTQFHHAEVERGLGFVLRIQYHHYTGTMAFSKSAMVTVALSMVSPWDMWPLLRLVPSPQLCLMETKWCRKGTRGRRRRKGCANLVPWREYMAGGRLMDGLMARSLLWGDTQSVRGEGATSSSMPS
jgi:hypothetical protein